MIDGVVLLVAQGILFSAGWMVSGGSTGGGTAVKGLVNVFGTLLGAAYGIIFHWLWGQTLGKMALQIKVVGMDGGPLTFGQAAGRYFATFLSAIILCIGFIMAGIRTDKRALTIFSPAPASYGSRNCPAGAPMALPLPLRNRLAELILDALHDPDARSALEAVARVCADPRALEGTGPKPAAFPEDIFERGGGGWQIRSGLRQHHAEFVSAALLFHAHRYSEVHELLEPYWLLAEGGDREALQGLIQVAVGFAHLANGNVAGARALLHDGCARVLERSLEGVPLAPFGPALQRRLDRVLALVEDPPPAVDSNEVPRFP